MGGGDKTGAGERGNRQEAAAAGEKRMKDRVHGPDYAIPTYPGPCTNITKLKECRAGSPKPPVGVTTDYTYEHGSI